mgnify:CR=1 FL=1
MRGSGWVCVGHHVEAVSFLTYSDAGDLCCPVLHYMLTRLRHLPRYKQMQEDMGDEVRQTQIKWLPDDNRTLFTFWTCLQLERWVSQSLSCELN